MAKRIMGNDETKTQKIEHLLDVMRILRDPLGGCPWDKEQNFASKPRQVRGNPSCDTGISVMSPF